MKSNEGGLRRAQSGVKGHGQTLPRLSPPLGAARSALRTPRARPHPRWPRSLQPLPPPAPSAHVPKAALRRRPDWQHAPANGGGERFLPANGGGAPRGQRAGRVRRRRGATVRRPMAAPEVRRGSAPTAPGGWGGGRLPWQPQTWRRRPTPLPAAPRPARDAARYLGPSCRAPPPPSSSGRAVSCAGGATVSAPPPTAARPGGQRLAACEGLNAGPAPPQL